MLQSGPTAVALSRARTRGIPVESPGLSIWFTTCEGSFWHIAQVSAKEYLEAIATGCLGVLSVSAIRRVGSELIFDCNIAEARAEGVAIRSPWRVRMRPDWPGTRQVRR